jgi:hypothetical protein
MAQHACTIAYTLRDATPTHKHDCAERHEHGSMFTEASRERRQRSMREMREMREMRKMETHEKHERAYDVRSRD